MLVKVLIRIILFALLSSSLQASHGAGAYLNARSYNNGWDVELELHLFQLDDGAVLQYPSSIQITGTRSFYVSISDTIIHPLGDGLCSSGSLREYIYRGSRSVYNFLSANDAVFEAVIICCLVDSVVNIKSISYPNPRTSIRIPTYFENNKFRLIPINTLNMQVSIQQSANTDQFTVLDYSVHSKPLGLDSIRYQLSPFSNPNGGPAYKSGYTYLNPLPDPTEDSLNAQNIFNSKRGTLSFRARGQSSDTGFYIINLDYEMYLDSAKLVRMTAFGMLFLQRGDSALSSTLDMRAYEGASTQIVQDGDTLSRVLFFGDSLKLALKSFSSSGFKLIDGGFSGMPDTSGANQLYQVQFQQPTMNTWGAGIGALDTIHKGLFWRPSLNDFKYRPGVYYFGFNSRLDTCGSLMQRITIEVHLLQKPMIIPSQDTIHSCIAQNLRLSAEFWYDSLFWRPGLGLEDSSSNSIIYHPRKSAYLYISHPRLGNLDSVYIIIDTLPNVIPLQRTANGVEMEFVEPQNSVYQEWWLNSIVKFPGLLEDKHPIIGAGTYYVWSYLDLDSCPNFTDTLRVPHDHHWGGNTWVGHPESPFSKTVLGDDSNPKYTQRMKVNKTVRQLENVYIIGIRNMNHYPEFSPIPVKVELQFPNGLYFTRTFNVKGERFIDYPIYYSMDTTTEVDISVTLPRSIELSMVEGTGASFEHNGLHFSDFRRITGTDTSATNLRPAIGFKFESNIGLAEKVFKPIDLFPNPASDYLILSAPIGSTWQIHSLSGQMVLEGRLEASMAEIQIDDFAPGLYLLSVEGQNLKFVKQ